MKSLALVEELVDGFRQVRPDARDALLSRIHEAVGDEIGVWLLPLLRHPPTRAQMEEVKVALRTHATSAKTLEAALAEREGFNKFVAEVRDSANPGTRALGVLARWAVAPPEEDDGDDDE